MKQRTMTRIDRPATWTPVLTMLVGGLFCAVIAVADSPPATPQGKHGDAAAEQQLAELQKLKLPEDVAQPPAGLDPVAWAAVVPEDNPMTPRTGRVGAEALLRHPTFQGRHRRLRHLP